MNLKIIPTTNFKDSTKALSKKYKRIVEDIKWLQNALQHGSETSIDLGHNCFKIRLPNSSIPTGKSGGFRVIYYKKIEDKIYLLEIYSKRTQENVSDEKILEILKANGLI